MRKFLVIALFMVGLTLAVTPSDAFANPPEPDPNAPSTTSYDGGGASDDEGVWGSIGKVVSKFKNLIYGPPFPGGRGVCRQSTDNAHQSGARVNVHVDARCPVLVQEMFHQASLLRSSNPQYGYSEVRNLTPKRGIFHKYNKKRGRAVANHHCSRHWFKGAGAGYVRYYGVDSISVAATSSPRPEFNPCGLP